MKPLTISTAIRQIAMGCIAAPTISVTLSATSLIQAAHASESDRRLEEIVVTAQRRSQSLMEVPQAVQAWSGEALQESGLENLDDIINVIPSATTTAAVAGGSTTFQIRGVSAGETDGDPTVGFYLDNFAFSMPGRPFAPVADFYDMERVEVLRGPSGTLYGLGSLGGTIKVITKDPDLYETEGSIRVTGSTSTDAEQSWSGDIMLNTPIIEGKLALRAVLTHKDIGGFADILPTGEKNANDAQSTTGRVKLLATPTEDLTLKLTYWRNRSPQDFQNRTTFADPPALAFTAGESPTEYKVLSGDIEYDLGFALLQSTTGYLKNKVDNYAVGFIPGIGNFTADWPLVTRSLNEDLRLSSQPSDTFNWIVGIFYQDSETNGGQDAYLPDIPTPGNVGISTVNRRNAIESESYAIYGEGTYTLLDGALDATLGGRLYREKRKFIEDSSLELLELGLVIPTQSVTESDNDTFNPRVNLAWHMTDDSTFYVEVAKGFRSGSITSTSIMGGANLVLGTDFDSSSPPDTLWNYQAGYKWQSSNGALQLELAAYQFDWDEAQIELSPTAQSIVAPIGDVRGRGFDFQVDWNTPIDGLLLKLSGNLNDTELRNVAAGVSAALPWLSNDRQLPGTARKTAAASASYQRATGYRDLDMRLYARYTYRSEQQSVFDGRYAPSIQMVTLRASVGNDEFEAGLFVNNATNEKDPLNAPGGQFVVPYPQTFGVSLERFF